MTTIVLGTQFGDEGKGKFVDIRCTTAKVCARFAGGNNAGHTIVANGVNYDFHILPSGLVNPGCVNLIGTGCVVHIPSFFEELETLQKKGLDTNERIYISDRAHITFNLHKVLDGLEEEELGGSAVGTTKKGIGPTYSTKAARTNARISDVFSPDLIEKKLRALEQSATKRYSELFKAKGYDIEAEIALLSGFKDRLEPFVIDAVPLITELPFDTDLLVEGANALMLDLDYGTYPFVTSSNTGLGSAIGSLCLDPLRIQEVVGIVKAYTTRVGSGPLPTEQLNENGNKLQEIGREYGVTTGRRRRCGWLDLVIVKHSHAVNHYRSLNLTKLDVLDTFSEIPIATSYKVDGKQLEYFPADLELLSRVEVVYTTLPGWQQPTVGITKWDELPENARAYVTFIEQYLRGTSSKGPQCKYIGTGPKREDMIVR